MLKDIEIINPYNKEIVGTLKNNSNIEIRDSLSKCSKNKDKLSLNERKNALQKLIKNIQHRRERLANGISEESGLCLKDTLHEVNRTTILLQQCLDYMDESEKDITPVYYNNQKKPYLKVVQEPLSLVCAVTPFNHPLNQVAHKLGPAIVANTNTLLKPSEKTPLTAFKFLEMLEEVGFSQHQFKGVINQDPEPVVKMMINHPMTEMISFTGEFHVGRKISTMVNKSYNPFIKQVYELGGNAALFVSTKADIDKATTIALGAFSNSGQRCTSIKRIIVVNNIADEFIDKFVSKAEKLKYGNPLDLKTDVGTVITESAAKEIQRRVKESINKAAKLIFGNRRDGALYSPTVIDNVKPHHEIVTKETFGPVAPIIRVMNMGQAIRIVNSSGFKLAGAIATEDAKEAKKYFESIGVGQFSWNGQPGFRYEQAPFGGFGWSGNFHKEGIIPATEGYKKVRTFYEH